MNKESEVRRNYGIMKNGNYEMGLIRFLMWVRKCPYYTFVPILYVNFHFRHCCCYSFHFDFVGRKFFNLVYFLFRSPFFQDVASGTQRNIDEYVTILLKMRKN